MYRRRGGPAGSRAAIRLRNASNGFLTVINERTSYGYPTRLRDPLIETPQAFDSVLLRMLKLSHWQGVTLNLWAKGFGEMKREASGFSNSRTIDKL
jgi:hypothetical protein